MASLRVLVTRMTKVLTATLFSSCPVTAVLKFLYEPGTPGFPFAPDQVSRWVTCQVPGYWKEACVRDGRDRSRQLNPILRAHRVISIPNRMREAAQGEHLPDTPGGELVGDVVSQMSGASCPHSEVGSSAWQPRHWLTLPLGEFFWLQNRPVSLWAPV